MKTRLWVTAAPLALVLVCTPALIQTLEVPERPVLLADYSGLLPSRPLEKPVLSRVQPRFASNWSIRPGNGADRLFDKAPARRPLPPAARAPGVYQARPFSGIVVVPGPHADDKCIVAPGGATPSMPVIPPELHLFPYRAK